MARLVVPPSGPPSSPFVIVGRDPGAHEERLGRPFVGPSGKLLDALLERASLKRGDFLVTNVVGVRPPLDEWHNHKAEDIAAGLKRLEELLGAAPRRLIVALGQQAFNACASAGIPDLDENDPSITEARGYLFQGPFGPVLPSFHPSACLYQWHPNARLLALDLEKAARLVRGSRTPNGERQELVLQGLDEGLVKLFTNQNFFTRCDLLAVDIETTPELDIACIGFSADPALGVCVPLPLDDAGVKEALASPVPKVFQNGQFDVTVLRRHGFEVNGELHDTMLMWHALEPTLAGRRESKKVAKRTEKSLRFLASVLTDEPFWKNYDFQNEHERYVLCAKDARVTLEIARELERRLQ